MLGIGSRQLGPDLRRSLLELGSAGGLGPGVEMVDRPPRVQEERVLFVRGLVGRDVVDRLEDRLPERVGSEVLGRFPHGSGEQVLPVRLAVIGIGPEAAIGVEALGTVRVLVVARPLDPRAPPELLVRDAGVIAGTAARALFPGLEGRFGVVPLDQGLTVLVPKIHAPCVVQEDVKIGLGLPGRLDPLLRDVNRAVGVREGAQLLAPRSGRQNDVGQLRSLGEEDVLHHDEEAFLLQYRPDPVEFRQRHRRVGALDPEEPDGALLREAEDLHAVGRLRVVRDSERIHVPQPGEVLYVGVVLPVPEAWQTAVGPRLARVLGGGLAVHLQDARPRLPQHPTDEVDVVDLAGGGGRLVRLIDALQRGREQPLGGAEDAGCLSDVFCRDPADSRRLLGRPVPGPLLKLAETHGMTLDVVVVDPAVRDDLVDERVEQREVGPVLGPEVEVCLLGHRGRPGIDRDQLGRPPAPSAVEDAHPGHRLGLGHVVPDHEERVGVVYVGVGAGLAVAGERLLEGPVRRSGAQAGVPVEVVGADASPGDHRQGVVVLQKELARGVEAERGWTRLPEQAPGALDDPVHRGVPIGLHEPTVLAQQRLLEPVGRVVGLPDKEVLGVHASVVYPIHRPTPHPDDASVLDREVQGVAVGMVQGGRLDPAVHLVLGDARLEELIDPHGPPIARSVGRPRPPRLGDAVDPTNACGLGSHALLAGLRPFWPSTAAHPDRVPVVAVRPGPLGLHGSWSAGVSFHAHLLLSLLGVLWRVALRD